MYLEILKLTKKLFFMPFSFVIAYKNKTCNLHLFIILYNKREIILNTFRGETEPQRYLLILFAIYGNL